MDEAGSSYIPVCSDGAVCVVSHRSNYQGSNFEAASFQVREINGATTQRACLTSPMRAANVPEFDIATEDPTRIINGVSFLHGISIDAGLGHHMSTDLYRAFHHGRCYELSINVAITSFANFDPGTVKEFTHDDEQRVRSELTLVLDSFRFLK
ncbi:MAG: hypothetical protein WBC04_24575 [Candidatus Acidiferrales bacterium]